MKLTPAKCNGPELGDGASVVQFDFSLSDQQVLDDIYAKTQGRPFWFERKLGMAGGIGLPKRIGFPSDDYKLHGRRAVCPRTLTKCGYDVTQHFEGTCFLYDVRPAASSVTPSQKTHVEWIQEQIPSNLPDFEAGGLRVVEGKFLVPDVDQNYDLDAFLAKLKEKTTRQSRILDLARQFQAHGVTFDFSAS